MKIAKVRDALPPATRPAPFSNGRSLIILSPRIHRRAALFIEGEDLIGLRIRPFHARRAHRHSRHRKADNRWFFFQHPLDKIRGHMPFDDVPIDHRCVAGIEPPRDSVIAFYVSELLPRNIFFQHLETVRLQVTHPRRAATSRRVGIHGYGRRAGN